MFVFVAILWIFLSFKNWFCHGSSPEILAAGLKTHLIRVSHSLTYSRGLFFHKETFNDVPSCGVCLKDIYGGIAGIIADLPVTRSHTLNKWFPGPRDVYSAHISQVHRLIYFKDPSILIVGVGDYHGEQGKQFKNKLEFRLKNIEEFVKDGIPTSTSIEKGIFIPWKPECIEE